MNHAGDRAEIHTKLPEEQMSKCYLPKVLSDVETEEHDISLLHNVIFSLRSQLHLEEFIH